MSARLTRGWAGEALRRTGRLVATLAVCSFPALYAATSGPLAEESRQRAASTAKPKQKKDAATRLAEAWPSEDKLKEHRRAAQALRLFSTDELFAFTLTADLRTLNRDRVRDSPNRYPAVLTATGADGTPQSIPVEIGTRGNLRLNARTCDFVPIRVEFPPKKQLTGTVFEGQKSLKLVTHCRNDNEYEQYVLGEYLAYRIYNLITPLSYRARLGRATYVDSTSGRTITTRTAMFIEDDDDVARRAEGRIVPLQNRLFRQLDPDSLTTMAIFHFMIGNTDYSIYRLHNVRLIQDRQGEFRPVTYDFDLSGLVNARYAVPDKSLRLLSIKDRLYRGPCRTVEEYEPLLARFREKKADVLALFDMPELDRSYRRDARNFIEDFFNGIDKKGDVKHYFVDRCPRVDGM